jgi:rhomboid protease GluP
MTRRSPVTVSLLVIIGVVFAFEVITGAFNSDEAMVQMGAIVPGLMSRGEYWRLIAAMFLHGGWLHWATNSWALYQLGTLYETLFGSKRFATIYFASGVIASMASSLYQHGPAVGASGAIFGILGAFIFSLLRSPQYRHQRWTKSLVNQIVFWIVVNIAVGFYLPFIDNVAHIAGLIAGLLLGFLPHRAPPPPPRDFVIEVEPSRAAQNDPYVLRPEDPLVDDGDGAPHRR